MRYLVWLVRLLVFVLILLFALNNTTPVDVRFYGEYLLGGVPLVIVMLGAFVAGMFFSLLLLTGGMLRRRREMRQLQRALTRMEGAAQRDNTAPDVEAAPSLAVNPLASQ